MADIFTGHPVNYIYIFKSKFYICIYIFYFMFRSIPGRKLQHMRNVFTSVNVRTEMVNTKQ